MSLLDLTLAAILSLPGTGAPADLPRLTELAIAIVEAVEEREMLADWLPGAVTPLPFAGRAREAAALALAEIAHHEGGLDPRVADCRITGDHGESIGPFQVMGRHGRGPYSRAEICGSVKLAARRALHVLIANGGRAHSAHGVFASYAGNGGKPSRASRELCDGWVRLSMAAGISASCSTRTTH